MLQIISATPITSRTRSQTNHLLARGRSSRTGDATWMACAAGMAVGGVLTVIDPYYVCILTSVGGSIFIAYLDDSLVLVSVILIALGRSHNCSVILVRS
jgi:hypothetical protein